MLTSPRPFGPIERPNLPSFDFKHLSIAISEMRTVMCFSYKWSKIIFLNNYRLRKTSFISQHRERQTAIELQRLLLRPTGPFQPTKLTVDDIISFNIRSLSRGGITGLRKNWFIDDDDDDTASLIPYLTLVVVIPWSKLWVQQAWPSHDLVHDSKRL